MNEVQNAGRPMPMSITLKLQQLACGFSYREPMICCVKPAPSTDNFNGLPNRGGPTSSEEVSNPYNSDRANAEPTRPIPGVNSNEINQDDPPNIQHHPNLRLLPKDCGVIEETNKIAGGNKTSLYEMPWMVLLSYDTGRGIKLNCGGTLINEWYVLTAAHCVSFLGRRTRLDSIILGEHDISRDPDCEKDNGVEYCAPSIRNVSINSIIPHPGYSPDTFFDDIALIRLAQPANFNLRSMKAICLPVTSQLQTENLIGKPGMVVGWGLTEQGVQSSVLLSVDLPIIRNEQCEKAYKGIPQIYKTQMCAGGIKNKDSCAGDSGGPVIYPGKVAPHVVGYVQRGIVSFGPKRCGTGKLPGVYTRVAYYMDWILDNMY